MGGRELGFVVAGFLRVVLRDFIGHLFEHGVDMEDYTGLNGTLTLRNEHASKLSVRVVEKSSQEKR